MTKKKHEENKTKTDGKEKTGDGFFSEKNYALIFTALGALIIGVIIGIMLNATVIEPVIDDPTNGNELGTQEETPVEVNEQEIYGKVKAFLDDSFFEQQGGEANVSDLTKINDNLYSLKIEFIVGEEVQGEFVSYVTPDNTQLISGVAYNMDEPLPTPEPQPTAEAQEYPKTDTPNVKMFVMTYCPYGKIAEEGLGPVYELLGEEIEFEPHFVYYSNYCGWGVKCQCDEGTNEDGMCTENPNYKEAQDAKEAYCFDFEEEQPVYCSMHGVQELNEGVRQTCAWKYDDHDKWWDYVELVNENCSSSNIDECWEQYAVEAGLDVESIKSCFDTEAESILAAEIALAEELGARGSPSIFINDTSYSGGRAPENYKQAICSSFNETPEACEQGLGAAEAAATGSC